MEPRHLVLSFLLPWLVLGCDLCSAKFFESFESDWVSRWTHSSESKYTGRFKAESPPGLSEPALKVPDKAKHYGLATKFDEAIDPSQGIAFQYELKLVDGLTCGGAYLKFITDLESFDAAALKEDTPYTVMFGPDKCGSTNKVHLIIRHKNPSGAVEEKHLISAPLVELDKLTHVYTAILKPDNTYELLIDGEKKKSGSLLEDLEPAINPPKEIDDPEDTKPEDWVDVAKIADPEAVKPEDWDEDAPRQIEDEDAEKPEGWLDDEPSEVDDPSASRPDDWDEEEDGEWEAPKIKNPACESAPGCGEWRRPMKPNPAYKGSVGSRKIDNPDYFEDTEPLSNIGKIGGVAVEIWTMDNNYFFDNILVTDDIKLAEEYRDTYWKSKHENETAMQSQEDKKKLEAASSQSLAERIIGLFRGGPLASIAPTLEPLLSQLEEKEWLAWPLLAVPVVLLLLPLLALLGGKDKKSKTVGQAKKLDISQPDDKAEGEEKDTDQADKDDDDDDKGVRRRRRDT